MTGRCTTLGYNVNTLPRVMQCTTWTAIPAVQTCAPVRPVGLLSPKFRSGVECCNARKWLQLGLPNGNTLNLGFKIHLTPASQGLIVQISIWILEPSWYLSNMFLFVILARVGFCYLQPHSSDCSAVVESVCIKLCHLYKKLYVWIYTIYYIEYIMPIVHTCTHVCVSKKPVLQ